MTFVALCLWLVPMGSQAGAVTTPNQCGKITVEGKTYKVVSHIVGCEFAKRWSKHFLKRGHKPDGWTCQRYSADQTDIAFRCSKPGKDFFAVRK